MIDKNLLMQLVRQEISNIEMRRRCPNGGMIGTIQAYEEIDNEHPIIPMLRVTSLKIKIDNFDLEKFNNDNELILEVRKMIKECWNV